ncbi:hypothetical protein KBZ20_14835 [Vulcanococcus limneticus Candia 3F8]|uniref:hypothetical protein n=1 Tax=Vulcanococcus limneticus TaxID=2170428 RepID=UPI000B9889A4|nr:hypothetical protein [Vulcanococcus limneticus]MCP9793111.1 hypothetical protein [Vulcanococcus limneticus MW73D5]MCP9895049.1 hypothetical protein [Vulcanococcus limneticus Candia 3F8]MCP9898519.1 hypothetical protein [Vulcanococcus limneticus Candia 3B3]
MSLAEVLVSTAVLSIAGTGSLQLTANLGHTLVSQRQLDGVMQQLDQAVQASHERMAQEGASASCADPAALLELLAARAAAATPEPVVLTSLGHEGQGLRLRWEPTPQAAAALDPSLRQAASREQLLTTAALGICPAGGAS